MTHPATIFVIVGCALYLRNQHQLGSDKNPTVHVPLTFPAQQKRCRKYSYLGCQASEVEVPQCVKLLVSDTVRMTYFEHAMPFLFAFVLIAGGLVLSLMRRPVCRLRASAYGQIMAVRDRERQRREAEAKEERNAMREGRRLARNLMRQDRGIVDDMNLNSSKIVEESVLSSMDITFGESCDAKFTQILEDFDSAGDDQDLLQCLTAMSLLFQENPALGRNQETKSRLIVSAKRKRDENNDIWTPEVAQEFGPHSRVCRSLGVLELPCRTWVRLRKYGRQLACWIGKGKEFWCNKE